MYPVEISDRFWNGKSADAGRNTNGAAFDAVRGAGGENGRRYEGRGRNGFPFCDSGDALFGAPGKSPAPDANRRGHGRGRPKTDVVGLDGHGGDSRPISGWQVRGLRNIADFSFLIGVFAVVAGVARIIGGIIIRML